MPNVRIVAISDTHGQHHDVSLPAGDILVFAGDIMTSGYRNYELFSFNAWLEQQNFAHKIVIAGNHDRFLEAFPDNAPEILSAATYLNNSGTIAMGLRFWGSPQSPAFNDWAFNVQRGPAIRQYWDRIPRDTDVLITHGPPLGRLDWIAQNQPSLGCADLAYVVTHNVRPRLHLFGHIHGGYGVNSGETTYANVSICNEQYRPVNKPQVFDLAVDANAPIGWEL